MSMARKCDRCGRFYESCNGQELLLSEKICGCIHDIDLCDVCVSTLKQWLNVGRYNAKKVETEEISCYVEEE